MLLIELVCLLKSNLPKTRLLSCNFTASLFYLPFSRVLFAWLCFDDFLRLLLPLIFSPTFHLPKLQAPQGLKQKGSSRNISHTHGGGWGVTPEPIFPLQPPLLFLGVCQGREGDVDWPNICLLLLLSHRDPLLPPPSSSKKT